MRTSPRELLPYQQARLDRARALLDNIVWDYTAADDDSVEVVALSVLYLAVTIEEEQRDTTEALRR